MRPLKAIGRGADPLRMQSEMETAIKRAGLKLGGGLLLLAALIGVRIVTVTPRGIESEIAELEQLESSIADSDRLENAPASPTSAADAEASGSILSGLGLGERESSTASGSTSSGSSSRDAERLVSCEIGGSVQFTRGADCATRGGRATDLD